MAVEVAMGYCAVGTGFIPSVTQKLLCISFCHTLLDISVSFRCLPFINILLPQQISFLSTSPVSQHVSLSLSNWLNLFCVKIRNYLVSPTTVNG